MTPDQVVEIKAEEKFKDGSRYIPTGNIISRQMIGKSFDHLMYFCECLSVLDYFAADDKNNLYQSVKEIFKKPKPVIPECKD